MELCPFVILVKKICPFTIHKKTVEGSFFVNLGANLILQKLTWRGKEPGLRF